MSYSITVAEFDDLMIGLMDDETGEIIDGGPIETVEDANRWLYKWVQEGYLFNQAAAAAEINAHLAKRDDS